jgi:hypothetical protein
MGIHEDKIQKLLNAYTKKKNWTAKGWLKIVKDNLSKEQYKKLLAQKPPPFKRFHNSWSKNNVLSIWKGDTWEQVIDFCKMVNIKPKQIMNYAAGIKIDHTNWKTIKIAALCKEKLEEENKKKKPRTPRSVILGLSSQLSDIDGNLELASDDKIYKTCWNAMKRTGR